MDTTLILTIISLCSIGILASVILYFVSQKFKVYEDPRIDDVEKILPGANCGGCGYPGCRGFAEKIVESTTMEGFFCPVGGSETMDQVATLLDRVADVKDPMVAVVRCNGVFAKRPTTNVYDGDRKCSIASSLYAGETDCGYGCLGMGDCVDVCQFDAIHVSKETGIVIVNQDNCTACGACVTACPKNIIELRKRGVKDRRVFVSCINKDKGGVAMKACKAACIGCKKCQTACPFDAIIIENNVAYIDYNKCKLCRKCVTVCPTGAIVDENFPTPAPMPKPVVKPENISTAKPVAIPSINKEEKAIEEIQSTDVKPIVENNNDKSE